MALVLKQNKTIVDPRDTTQTLPTAYAVIDQCNGNKAQKIQHFVLQVYARPCTKEERAESIIKELYSKTYNVSGDDFDPWFSAQAITDDDNQYARAYTYLLQLEENIGTQDEPDMQLVYRDWQSD